MKNFEELLSDTERAQLAAVRTALLEDPNALDVCEEEGAE